jgi:hypothetical protein
MSRGVAVPISAVCILILACGGGSEQPGSAETEEAAAASPARAIVITSPAEGETVQGPGLTVRLEARGFTVVPAGDATPNSGHLHLYLDRDLSASDVPIPVEPGFIVHLGTGATEFVFENVPAGEHRLIAAVGDALHVPLQPWVVDTVRFTVR